MMIQLQNIFLCACAGWSLVNIIGWHRWHPILMRKPFACEKCCAGWLACWLCWSGWYTPIYMMAAMVVTIILTGYIKRLPLI